jgi:DNA-binding Lrp family transcriptional regulator
MIDDIDRKILVLLQKNCRLSIADIGEKVGLSASACHRRIGIMEKSGVIERYAARLNGEALGFNMTFYVEVTLEGQSEMILSTFEKAAVARPEVLECHLMTGSADYLIKVAAPDTKEYERLYKRVISALPHVSRIQSSLVMKTVKRWGGYPPQNLRS